MRRLHRLGHDAAQVGAERLEIELVAQTAAERLECPRGVVAAAEEAPVDRRLDAGARGWKSAATASVEAAIASPDWPTASADQQHQSEVCAAQRRGQGAVDQRPVDDDSMS